ncbi:MAG: hypothetical protein P4L46_01420 [Fimbriimonas sp.]|nr:hypothetical protein [Fimbriimonas sp.]
MLGLILVSVVGLSGEPSLMARARHVMDPGDWVEWQSTVPQYAWVNSHEVVYQEWTPRTEARRDFWVIDVRSHTKRKLDFRWLGADFEALARPSPSPNGTLILWEVQKLKDSEWLVTDRQGRLVGRWPRHARNIMASSIDEESYSAWSADGRSVLEFDSMIPNVTGIQVWRRSLTNPHHEDILPLLGETIFPPNGSNFTDLGDGQAELVRDRFNGALDDSKCTKEIVRWSYSAPKQIERNVVTIPRHGEIWLGAVSPDRHRLVWLNITPERTQVSLWSSHIDGSSVREIGMVRCKNPGGSGEAQYFGEVHWIPGRSAVSFVYHHHLYEVDVS